MAKPLNPSSDGLPVGLDLNVATSLILETLLFASTRSIFIIDARNGQFLFSNKKAQAFYGFADREFLSLKVNDLAPQLDLIGWDRYVEKIKLNRDRQLTVLGMHRKKNGITCPVRVVPRYIEAPAGPFVIAEVEDWTRFSRERQEFAENERLIGMQLSESMCIDQFRQQFSGLYSSISESRNQILGERIRVIRRNLEQKKFLKLLLDSRKHRELLSEYLKSMIEEIKGTSKEIFSAAEKCKDFLLSQSVCRKKGGFDKFSSRTIDIRYLIAKLSISLERRCHLNVSFDNCTQNTLMQVDGQKLTLAISGVVNNILPEDSLDSSSNVSIALMRRKECLNIVIEIPDDEFVIESGLFSPRGKLYQSGVVLSSLGVRFSIYRNCHKVVFDIQELKVKEIGDLKIIE
ncbi:PAS domain S-box protein [Sulfidibacter corallicola]|uniref:PAS domain S-box protein n=1 Tax=Sulfidibacter corallicola TaxID=2818388 RepID=A0A8A4TYH3_SULCO|nr:PAS domain S-box protein [Sulfidibacter corallicola]QTD54278.1 PAS domain S-box protein [Sulfidibacter corallicola]